MTPRSSTTPERRPRGGFALVGTIGGYVLGSVFGGLGIGFLLDHSLGTTPLFLMIGLLVGFALSFYLIYRLAMEIGD